MSRFTFRQSLPFGVFLVFALLLNLSLSSWLNPAQVAAQPATFKAASSASSIVATSAATTITACVGTTTSTSKVTLAGRVITPSTILRLAPSGICATGETSVSLAQNGTTYARTVLVSPSTSNDPTQNGQALLSAMTTISNASPSVTNPYLLKVEPGNYYITSSLTLLPYVDLEGSGEDTTVISSTYSIPGSGALVAASNSEVRSVTIASTGRAAIYVGSGVANAQFSHVTGTATTSDFSEGLENNGTISASDSTFSGNGGTETFGINNSNGKLTLTGSNLDANGTGVTSGLYSNGVVTVTNSVLKAYGSAITTAYTNLSSGYGNFSGCTFIVNGSTNSNSAAIDFGSTNPVTVTNSTITSLGGFLSYGLDGNGAVILGNSIVNAMGGISENTALESNGTAKVYNSTLTGTGGNISNGISSNSTITIYNSTLVGTGGTIFSYGFFANNNSAAKVVNSQLSGSTAASNGPTICPLSVNSVTFVQLNSSCQ